MPEFKNTVTEVDIKKVGANDELAVALYFEPLKSTQASLNVHLDYESKGGQSSGVSTAVFERVNLYKEGASLNLSDLDNASKAEIISESVPGEVVEASVEDVEVAAEVVDVVEDVSSDVEVLDTVVEEAEAFETEEEPEEEPKKKSKEKEKVEEAQHDVPDPGESGVDDIMSKLGELDDPENKPKKKEKKSNDDEDAEGMDDILGKLDEL